MSRDTPITFYVEKSEAESLRREADRQDKSLSTHVYDLVTAERDRKTSDERLRELNAEERIEGLLADVRDLHADMSNMTARAGVYSIANFELLKRDHTDSLRQDALDTGSQRLRKPIEEHDHSGGGSASGSRSIFDEIRDDKDELTDKERAQSLVDDLQ